MRIIGSWAGLKYAGSLRNSFVLRNWKWSSSASGSTLALSSCFGAGRGSAHHPGETASASARERNNRFIGGKIEAGYWFYGNDEITRDKTGFESGTQEIRKRLSQG